MEPTNKPSLMRWLDRGQRSKGKTVVEYLPDADEIERNPVPRGAQITMHVLLVAFATFAVWASVSQLDKVVVAQGRLINPFPNLVVQPLETSIIQSVDVRVGQVVKKGETLATLDATFAQADEGQLKSRLLSIETQIQGFQQELSGDISTEKLLPNPDDKLQAELLVERRANYRAQQMRLTESSAKLRAALASNREDQRLVTSRLRSVKELELIQEKMVEQKFGAPLQLIESQLRTKEVARELEQIISHENQIKRDLAAADSEKVAFEKGWRQKLMEDLLSTSRERDSLKEQLLKADKRSKLVTLVAPLDSVVLEIAKLSKGSIVQGAETFFTLVPLNVTLEAEVQIDSMDVGYIKLSHPVNIKLDSYPYQKHGTLDAKVRSISGDAFRKDSAGNPVANAYYQARVALESTKLKNMPESARLLPGMTLSAEIVVGKRSVLSYLAWPLTKGLDEAGREP